MAFLQLLGLVLVLAFCGVGDAQRRGMRPPPWAGKMQNPEVAATRTRATSGKDHFPSLLDDGLDPKRIRPAGEQLKWKFPEPPADPVNRPPVQFKLQQPVVTNRVAVKCGESKVQVEVSQDLLGIGALISPDEITLGGCPVTEVDDHSQVLIFESELHECGSTLMLEDKGFVYAFKLIYNPKSMARSPITRSQSTAIAVECHYKS
ncbi:Zona pellucida sperm-binding protein 3 [Oryzias melastigma]|uniref:Zona pellucida sperm-binding protein 3 n=1 Tax=Oryzias melastigma TaxID=30732 RepID=A0A834KYX7_ORYME|nr:uncharacterized protein LOC112136404 [Oryzias melastigma]KAF6735970.1 Zona pellucida sperm-binding protein 3 [Oryzias melastigma]